MGGDRGYLESMPKHDIEVAPPAHRVVNTDLNVTVKSDSRNLGETAHSRGTVDWRPAKHESGVSMRWERFARLVDRWGDVEVR